MLRSSRKITTLWPSRIPNEEYATRRDNLMKTLKKETKIGEKQVVIVMKGARKSFIAPDVPHAFRQKSHFRYINGITSPDCYYLLQSGTTSSTSNSILFADRRSAYDELWEGKLPSESDWEATAKFSEIVPTNRLLQTLEKVCDKSTAVFFDSASDDLLHKFLQVKAASVRELNHFASINAQKRIFKA
uniref:AMP_N domain-containing protein n=1 Tax=Caenorhabditis japonica TaxID=281687 RepID=A0A8R1I420_CAEJA